MLRLLNVSRLKRQEGFISNELYCHRVRYPEGVFFFVTENGSEVIEPFEFLDTYWLFYC